MPGVPQNFLLSQINYSISIFMWKNVHVNFCSRWMLGFWSLSGTWWRPKEDNINQHNSPLHTGINLQERGKTLSWDEMVIQLKEKEMHFQRLLSSNFVLFNYVRKASNCQGPEVHYLPCCLEPTSKQTLAYINTKLSGGTNCASEVPWVNY